MTWYQKWEQVKRQAPAIELNKVKSEQPETDEVLNLAFPPVGEELAAECTRPRDKQTLGMMFCFIEVKYSTLRSFLIISASKDMDVQDFQKFIESLLLATDAHIKSIDQ